MAAQARAISIPALREEGDWVQQAQAPRYSISIPALREEGDVHFQAHRGTFNISIPALREEGDARTTRRSCRTLYFYPRPPRGGRPSGSSDTISVELFLSPPSARRATFVAEQRSCPPATYFYPRPPRGGRRGARREVWRQYIFLSPPSARRATARRLRRKEAITYFYPRPPRGGRLVAAFFWWANLDYFYPRPPRGGRQQKQRQNLYFQTNYTTFCTNLEEP